MSAMQYNEKIMERFLSPENIGEDPEADGIGEVGGGECGDLTRIYLRVENGSVTGARFTSFGCVGAVAAGSAAAQLALGRTPEQAAEFSAGEIVEVLGDFPEEKQHCPENAALAVRRAAEDYIRKGREKGK
ncbi:MAG: iron-sulfur cluster assembly scaffold protein [Ruminococcus sp.]|nr:iron-sulfur cluster assembly scaffold protein [Ruminococcus sp.]